MIFNFFEVLHPAGNVAEHLVANGLARIVEWHAGMLASSGGMEKLRSAEKSAKEKRLNLYASQPSNSSAAGASSTTPSGGSREYDATVIRIWSGDQVSVVTKEGKERRLQLSSTRGPKYVNIDRVFLICMLISQRLSDPRQATYAQEAKEFLRKKLIGKSVKIHIDFIRPKEGEFDERECATIRYGGHNA